MKPTRRTQTKPPPSFPITSKHGVKIYRGTRQKAGREYEEFTVVWTTAGRRERRSFASLDAATIEQELADRKIADGEVAVLALTGADRELYLDAKSRADALGKTLATVLQEYEDAFKRLEGRGGIGEAVDYFVRNFDRRITPKPLPQVCAELLEKRKSDGRSDRHRDTLAKHFKTLSEAFPFRIDEVKLPELEAFLSRWTGRTRNNVRASIVNLFGYAKKRCYIAPDRDTEAERLDRVREAREEIEILTVEEARGLLDWYQANRPDLLPLIAISLFAGARTSEIKRLDWKDVRLERGHILLAANKTKMRARRIVPVQPVLAAWLTPHRQEAGPVCALKRPEHKLSDYTKRAGVEWKHNGGRHSFISYRIAILKNDHEVASEAGNSATQVHRSYREVVTDDDARAWWSLFPRLTNAKVAEVIPISATAAENPISEADQNQTGKTLRTDHGAPTNGAQQKQDTV